MTKKPVVTLSLAALLLGSVAIFAQGQIEFPNEDSEAAAKPETPTAKRDARAKRTAAKVTRKPTLSQPAAKPTKKSTKKPIGKKKGR